MRIVRTDQEVNDLLNAVVEGIDGSSRFPGMSYEQGIQEAVRWLIGDCDDQPYPEA